MSYRNGIIINNNRGRNNFRDAYVCVCVGRGGGQGLKKRLEPLVWGKRITENIFHPKIISETDKLSKYN